MVDRKAAGFTLIELMIVVAIIGIIAAIAVPSYQRHVESTRRTTAQGDLLELAQFMERRYTNGYDYRTDGGNAPALPFTAMPRQGNGTVFYNYAFEGNVTRTDFTLRATPASSQTEDDCGWLEIDEAGTRSSESGDAECW
ncbi:type IV pilin protein [Marinobacter sp. HL-58]|uniref:type IV pilin protein n=1 Tax=Marinobacter sp. HL-58 TaxID=1479237 RepID=UPI00048200E8|nr:type IV pilin protein [Marinobacter sp. HL-58]KPQ01844.1 MAG: T4SS system assembly protein PilE [Marinobacter sp. HL-58]